MIDLHLHLDGSLSEDDFIKLMEYFARMKAPKRSNNKKNFNDRKKDLNLFYVHYLILIYQLYYLFH